jgi:adenosylmethionine-8-amino-7-oxononanoate aminotransferase
MAKGITNGAQPMGAVAISERIHDTVMAAAPEGAIEFFHGYTYSGHPGPCAAGLATLDIYKNDGLFERGRELSPYFLDALFALRDLPVVADLRGYDAGAIGTRTAHRARSHPAKKLITACTSGDRRPRAITPPIAGRSTSTRSRTSFTRRQAL